MDVGDIDRMLAHPKTMAGTAVWALDRRETVLRLAVPLAMDGVLSGFILHARMTYHTEPQRGAVALVLEGQRIQRMSILPDHDHLNPFVKTAPPALRGLRLPANHSRLHAWRVNRAWPRAATDNLAVAEPLDPQPQSVAATLAIFLGLCAIEGDLPPPPWEPRLL